MAVRSAHSRPTWPFSPRSRSKGALAVGAAWRRPGQPAAMAGRGRRLGHEEMVRDPFEVGEGLTGVHRVLSMAVDLGGGETAVRRSDTRSSAASDLSKRFVTLVGTSWRWQQYQRLVGGSSPHGGACGGRGTGRGHAVR
jgi:hypothetical protein